MMKSLVNSMTNVSKGRLKVMRKNACEKLLAFAIILSMILSLPTTALAADTINADDSVDLEENFYTLGNQVYVKNSPISVEIIEEYYSFSEEEVEGILSEETAEDELGAVARSVLSTTATVYGPYTYVQAMPANCIKMMLTTFQGNQGITFYPETYNGVECYKFTDGTDVVYVANSAFQKTSTQVYPDSTSASTALTYYANARNTDYVCSAYGKSVYSDSGYFWEIAQVGTQVSDTNEEYVTMQTKVLYSTSFTAYPGYILVNGTGYTTYQPELRFGLSNVGSSGTYIGKFLCRATAHPAYKVDISSLVTLGYNATQLASGGVSFDTLWNMFETTLEMTKGTESNYYASETFIVSNPALSRYVRECIVESPYVLTRPSNYFELWIDQDSYTGTGEEYYAMIIYDF